MRSLLRAGMWWVRLSLRAGMRTVAPLSPAKRAALLPPTALLAALLPRWRQRFWRCPRVPAAWLPKLPWLQAMAWAAVHRTRTLAHEPRGCRAAALALTPGWAQWPILKAPAKVALGPPAGARLAVLALWAGSARVAAGAGPGWRCCQVHGGGATLRQPTARGQLRRGGTSVRQPPRPRRVRAWLAGRSGPAPRLTVRVAVWLARRASGAMRWRNHRRVLAESRALSGRACGH